jgi:hypothetical protein
MTIFHQVAFFIFRRIAKNNATDANSIAINRLTSFPDKVIFIQCNVLNLLILNSDRQTKTFMKINFGI